MQNDVLKFVTNFGTKDDTSKFMAVQTELVDPSRAPTIGTIVKVVGTTNIVKHAVDAGAIRTINNTAIANAGNEHKLTAWLNANGKPSKTGWVMASLQTNYPELNDAELHEKYGEVMADKTGATDVSQDVDSLQAFSVLDSKAAEEFKKLSLQACAFGNTFKSNLEFPYGRFIGLGVEQFQ